MAIKIELKYPLNVKTDGGGVISVKELTLSRMKAKHLKLLPKGFFNTEGDAPKDFNPYEMLPLIASLSGIKDEEAGEIDIEDLMVIVKDLGPILGPQKPRQTGVK